MTRMAQKIADLQRDLAAAQADRDWMRLERDAAQERVDECGETIKALEVEINQLRAANMLFRHYEDVDRVAIADLAAANARVREMEQDVDDLNQQADYQCQVRLRIEQERDAARAEASALRGVVERLREGLNGCRHTMS